VPLWVAGDTKTTPAIAPAADFPYYLVSRSMGQTSLAMLEKPNIIGAVRDLIRLRILSWDASYLVGTPGTAATFAPPV
jgi:hypothetical protein